MASVVNSVVRKFLFVGIVIKMAARAFQEKRLRRFICDLLVTAVHGDVDEVVRILQNPFESLRFVQLDKYAKQIVARRQRQRYAERDLEQDTLPENPEDNW